MRSFFNSFPRTQRDQLNPRLYCPDYGRQITSIGWLTGLPSAIAMCLKETPPSVRLILSTRIELPITTTIKMKIKLPPYFQPIKSSSFYRLQSSSDQKHLPLVFFSFFSSRHSAASSSWFANAWNRCGRGCWTQRVLDAAGTNCVVNIYFRQLDVIEH